MATADAPGLRFEDFAGRGFDLEDMLTSVAEVAPPSGQGREDILALVAIRRAELARLRAAQRRATTLAAAMGDLVVDGWAGWGVDPDADLWVCFYCGAKGAMEGAPDPPGHKSDCPLALARALLAGAGSGVAGARDETITALTKVAQIVVDCRDLPAGEFRDRWGVVTWADYYDKLTALADAALDALRDGGAG